MGQKRKGDKIKKFFWIILVILSVLLFVFLMIFFNRQNSEIIKKEFPDRGLPVMEIDLDEIDGGLKDVEYGENSLKVYCNDELMEYDGLKIRGRGNLTWEKEKKPYKIKLNRKVDLLGMGKAKKWNLLANYSDATNIRNEVAFDLIDMLGMEYNFKGKFVELYIDGDYRGLYYLTHVVEIGKNMVDLRDPFGILVELDNRYWGREEYYETRNEEHLIIKDVVSYDNKEAAMEDFLNSFNKAEVAIEEKNYKTINEIIDVDSFAKYYLLSEFINNPDAYWTSFYFYKDGLDDKIHAGPGWDFDLSFANKQWGNWMGELFYSPTQMMARKGELLPKEFYEEMGVEGGYEVSIQLSRIMYDLMDIPEFQREVERVYRERISGRIEDLIMMIDDVVKDIEVTVKVDEKRWQKGNFQEEMEEMVKWIKMRYDFFEKVYGYLQKSDEVIDL